MEDDMPTLSHPALESDLAIAPRGARVSSRRAAPQPDFAPTEFMLNDLDDDFSGFAPTEILEAPVLRAKMTTPKPVAKRVIKPAPAQDACEAQPMPASWTTVRWVEEQEAIAAAAARRATAGNRVHRVLGRTSARPAARLGWIARLESLLQRVLPPNLGTFLSLFVCVALAIMLMSAMLPIVDRI
jgi:hypothetical protein